MSLLILRRHWWPIHSCVACQHLRVREARSICTQQTTKAAHRTYHSLMPLHAADVWGAALCRDCCGKPAEIVLTP
jgi:hypothetical protein